MKKRVKKIKVFLSLDAINVLSQVRRTFEQNGIQALADNICKLGLIDPVTAVSFSSRRCQDYIDLTNKFYKAVHKISELKMSKGKQFIVMLSGERRLRAHQLIWHEGCLACREKYGEEKPGNCFKRHFGKDKKVKAHLWHNLSALDAIDIQLSGNSYVPPSEAETMEALSLQFQVKKEKNPKLKITEFARSVGRDPSTISGYLKIFELPAEVLDFFRKGLISSGIAREIAFLCDNGEKDLMWWVRRAAVSRDNVEVFRKKVRVYLASRAQTILEIFDQKAEEQRKKALIKEVVAKEILDGIWAHTAYWKKVLRLFETGKLGKKDSPFSAKSPVHLYRQQVELMRQGVLPHLEALLPKKVITEVKNILAKVELTLAKAEEKK
jgi:hypothetical protein